MQTNNLIIYRENGRVYNYNLLPPITKVRLKQSFYLNYKRSTSKDFTLLGDFCGLSNVITEAHLYYLESGSMDELIILENKSVIFGTYNRPFMYNYYDGFGHPYHLN